MAFRWKKAFFSQKPFWFLKQKHYCWKHCLLYFALTFFLLLEVGKSFFSHFISVSPLLSLKVTAARHSRKLLVFIFQWKYFFLPRFKTRNEKASFSSEMFRSRRFSDHWIASTEAGIERRKKLFFGGRQNSGKVRGPRSRRRANEKRLERKKVGETEALVRKEFRGISRIPVCKHFKSCWSEVESIVSDIC